MKLTELSKLYNKDEAVNSLGASLSLGVPAAIFGEGIVQRPEDLAVIPQKDHMVIADGDQGMVVVSIPDGKIHQRLPEVVECGAVCYAHFSGKIVASVTKVDDTIEIWSFTITEDTKLLLDGKIVLPNQPEVRIGYNRWITTDPLTGDYFVSCGDSKIAALWRYSQKSKTWKTILERTGHLEHPCVLPRIDPRYYEIVVTAWTNEDLWHVRTFSFDDDNLCHEKVTIKTVKDLINPWAVAIEPKSAELVLYDYQSGNLYKSFAPDYGTLSLGGIVKAGCSASLDFCGPWIWCSSDAERLIRGFRDKTDYEH